jgi:tRNA(fMet)-specific endonuclease VapC
MTHLLDTDYLSLLQQEFSRERAAIVTNINLCPGDVAVSVVSFHEQVLGCHNAINQARTRDDLIDGYARLQRVIRSYTTFVVLPFDTAAAAAFDSLKAQKVRISTMDRRIAAVALSQKLVLVTRNVRDFGKVPGLRTEDWTK